MSGVPDAKKHTISGILGMPLGSLHIKYLGLPLPNRKLSYSDCSPLLEKLSVKINIWTLSKLSYEGKLQLVNSVLVP